MALDGINTIEGVNGKEITVVDSGYDNSKMSNDDFLKVLLTDLQWQDPLEAKDISQFIGNTVKLREMEVLNDFQSTVETLKKANETNALVYASSLIGKKILYEGNQTYIKDGKGTAKFSLESNADIVEVTLLDSQGNVVERKSFQNLQAGKEYPFEINNNSLEDGYYTVYVNAKSGGTEVKAKVYSYANVESVEKDNDQIFVSFGNNKVELNKVSQIGG